MALYGVQTASGEVIALHMFRWLNVGFGQLQRDLNGFRWVHMVSDKIQTTFMGLDGFK